MMPTLFVYVLKSISPKYADKGIVSILAYTIMYSQYRDLNCEDFRHLSQSDFDQYVAKAKNGNSGAQLRVGMCYLYGQVVDVNFREALKWFDKASKEDALALFFCGYFEEMGYLSDSNISKAIDYYERVFDIVDPYDIANQGDVEFDAFIDALMERERPMNFTDEEVEEMLEDILNSEDDPIEELDEKYEKIEKLYGFLDSIVFQDSSSLVSISCQKAKEKIIKDFPQIIGFSKLYLEKFETLFKYEKVWVLQYHKFINVSVKKKLLSALVARDMMMYMLNQYYKLSINRNPYFEDAVGRILAPAGLENLNNNDLAYNLLYLAHHDNDAFWQTMAAICLEFDADYTDYNRAELLYKNAVQQGYTMAKLHLKRIQGRKEYAVLKGEIEVSADELYEMYKACTSNYYQDALLSLAASMGNREAFEELRAKDDVDMKTESDADETSETAENDFSRLVSGIASFRNRIEKEAKDKYEATKYWHTSIQKEKDEILKQEEIKQEEALKQARIQEAEKQRQLQARQSIEGAYKTGIVIEIVSDAGFKHSGTVCAYTHHDDDRYKRLEDFLKSHTCKKCGISNYGRGYVLSYDGQLCTVNFNNLDSDSYFSNTQYQKVNDIFMTNFDCVIVSYTSKLLCGGDDYNFDFGSGSSSKFGSTSSKPYYKDEFHWSYVMHPRYTDEQQNQVKELISPGTRNISAETKSLIFDGRSTYVHVSDKSFCSNDETYHNVLKDAHSKYGFIYSAFASDGAIVVCCEKGVYYKNLPINIVQEIQRLTWIPSDIKFTNTGLYIISGPANDKGIRPCVYKLTDEMSEAERAAFMKAQEEAKRKEEEAKKKAAEEKRAKAEARKKAKAERLAREEEERLERERNSIVGRIKGFFGL